MCCLQLCIAWERTYWGVELTKHTPIARPRLCEDLGENWPRYNGTALYYHLQNGNPDSWEDRRWIESGPRIFANSSTGSTIFPVVTFPSFRRNFHRLLYLKFLKQQLPMQPVTKIVYVVSASGNGFVPSGNSPLPERCSPRSMSLIGITRPQWFKP